MMKETITSGEESSPTIMSPESDSASNGGVSSDESTSLRKRKRESEEEKEQTTEDTRRLTSRQLALKGKKGPSLFSEKKNPTKQLTVEQQRKKTQQAEKRKRQKQEQMLVQKDAILRKFANAANAPVETAPDTQKDKRSEKVNQVSDVRYTSSTSGNFLSFAPHMTLPDWVAPKEKQDERENEKEKNRSLVLCSIPNCGKAHRYYDSKTKQPLCSFQCYQVLHCKK